MTEDDMVMRQRLAAALADARERLRDEACDLAAVRRIMRRAALSGPAPKSPIGRFYRALLQVDVLLDDGRLADLRDTEMKRLRAVSDQAERFLDPKPYPGIWTARECNRFCQMAWFDFAWAVVYVSVTAWRDAALARELREIVKAVGMSAERRTVVGTPWW